MSEKMKLQDAASCSVSRGRRAEDSLRFVNPVLTLHYRGGKLIGVYNSLNTVTNEGKNYIFDVMFNSGVQITSSSWVISLISSSGYTAIAAADTMASHSGWTEFTTYSQSNRVAWGSGSASGQAVTNASPATFDITGSGTIKGIFVTSNNTKSGTTGKLWAATLFGADVPVTSGDQLKITYTVSA